MKEAAVRTTATTNTKGSNKRARGLVGSDEAANEPRLVATVLSTWMSSQTLLLQVGTIKLVELQDPEPQPTQAFAPELGDVAGGGVEQSSEGLGGSFMTSISNH